MKPCIEWQGARTGVGYGSVKKDGRTVAVHRLAWEERHGPIPDGLCVLHKCDNRACYNVEHLFLGTRRDNSKDMATKGRAVSPTKRLTQSQVEEIRNLIKAGLTNRAVAARFNADPATISRIRCGRSYR